MWTSAAQVPGSPPARTAFASSTKSLNPILIGTMTCSEAKLKLEPCASGTLPPEEKIALEEHLATCEGCRLELELTRAVLGSPAFDAADEPAPNNPEHAPMSGDAPPACRIRSSRRRPRRSTRRFPSPTSPSILTPQPGTGPPGPAAPHHEEAAPTPAGAKAGAGGAKIISGTSSRWTRTATWARPREASRSPRKRSPGSGRRSRSGRPRCSAWRSGAAACSAAFFFSAFRFGSRSPSVRAARAMRTSGRRGRRPRRRPA